jgi:hypothetical protein
MVTVGDEIMPKICHKFYCEICDYGTSKKSSFDNHNLSAKHQKKHKSDENGDKCDTKPAFMLSTVKKIVCKNCDKSYMSRNGLWKHKNKCNILAVNDNFVIDKEFVMMIIKQNAELQTNVLELMKKGTHNIISQNTNSQNNNKTFNLQFFLNETCKDAMNIMDFVDSIKPTLEDLENTGKVGYVEGISKIIVDNLKELETCERPIHCSNIKKEVLYIKDKDKWTQEKPVLTKAIHTIANKNIKNINEWKEENPGCRDSDSKKNDAYLHIVMNSMSGSSSEETCNNMNKIITKVAKEIVIEK